MASAAQRVALLPHVGPAHWLCIPAAQRGLCDMQCRAPQRVLLPARRETLVPGNTNIIGFHDRHLYSICQGLADPPALGST